MPDILRVALPVPLPQLFDYLPPEDGEVTVGSRVQVPFARGQQVGLVVAVASESQHAPDKLKRIIQLLDTAPLLDAELLASIGWAAGYWLGTPGEAYLGALPTVLRGALPWPKLDDSAWTLTAAGRAALDAGTRRGRSHGVLAQLAEVPLRAADLDLALPGWRAAAQRLAKAGLIEQVTLAPAAPTPTAGPQLSDEQAAAVTAINAAWGEHQTWLLDGVTGSGKTEVYLELIARALSEGRQSLLLVPEIGLAPQTLRRLGTRLGVPIEVLHSNLAAGDRARAWLRARDGTAKVVVGTRSAVFTPLPNAGLIIVDEEHDTSYKQQEGFRYHARDLALVRAKALGIPIVLGSATPSLESLANVAAGRHHLLRLDRRPRQRPAPQIRILDSRGPRPDHGLVPALLETLDQCIARGEQALVFRNRRGYAPVLICHACGWHSTCPHCDRSMTLHQSSARLLCHHCGHRVRLPPACPGCGADTLKARGFGTERIEEALAKRYPDVPVLRVDSETTRRRNAFDKLLEKLHADGPVILVGTQMLAKGHDLPGLTLVAISGVDEGLYSVDFRAGERLAQLIVQVAGRAGRADKPGSVVLQTHYPEHPLLSTLLQHGYRSLAAQLLDERRAAQLPPFTHQALLRAQAPRADMLDTFLLAAHDALPNDPTVRVMGPLPAPMPRRAGQQRGQLLLEADQRADLRRVLHTWQQVLYAMATPRALRWSLDMDPVDLY